MLLVADGSLDDLRMVGVWDQGDDQVDLLERLVECGRIVHVEGDGLGVLEAFGELLCALERSAGCVWNSPMEVNYYASSYISSYPRTSSFLLPTMAIDQIGRLHTDSDLNVSLRQNLNRGLGDYISDQW